MTEQEENQLKQEMIKALSSNEPGSLIDVLAKVPTKYFYYDSRISIKNCPKAKELLKQFMIANSNGQVPELDDDSLAMAIFVNPRMLYDFFDNNEIYIDIYKSSTELEWYYDVNSFGNANQASNRHETERSAFGIAFKELEDKLNETKR